MKASLNKQVIHSITSQKTVASAMSALRASNLTLRPTQIVRLDSPASIDGRSKDSLCHHAQPASYPIGTGSSLSGIKAAETRI
jgi:hypothetical protein